MYLLGRIPTNPGRFNGSNPLSNDPKAQRKMLVRAWMLLWLWGFARLALLALPGLILR
jgi:hypothetical protein